LSYNKDFLEAKANRPLNDDVFSCEYHFHMPALALTHHLCAYQYCLGLLARAALATGLLFFCLLCLATGANAEDPGQTEEKIKQIDSEIQQLKDSIGKFKTQRNSLQSELRSSELNIGKLQKRIATIQNNLKKEQKELQALKAQRESLNSSKKEQQKYISQQIVSAYQLGKQKKLKVLLNQEDPDKLTRALTYYDYFNRARSDMINDYIDLISEIDLIEPKIESKTAELQASQLALTNERNKLVANKKIREQSLAKINASIKNQDQRLKIKAKDRAELERLLEAVEQTLANISIPSDFKPFKQLRGKLPWPIKGKPSNRFGSRKDSRLKWQGLNIPAKQGSEIKAIHHGRVVFSDWFRGLGLLVIVDHGDGYMSLYAHNESLLRETGDWVLPGEIIATVGNSGGQSRSSLYFEIRYNGQPTDPKRWCKRA